MCAMLPPHFLEYSTCKNGIRGWWCGVLVRRKMGVLLAMLLLTPFIVLMMVKNPDLSQERLLAEQVTELRERLLSATALNSNRMHDVAQLAAKFQAVMPAVNMSLGNISLSHDALQLLQNVSLPGALRLPTIYSYLPYLLRDQASTVPAYTMSKGRNNVEIVLGIPTVKREVQSYLMTTLHNLINSMSEQEKNTSLIVVFVAEADLAYVHKIASRIERNLFEHVNSGLLELIAPPASFYPDFNTLKQTLDDPIERVRWRTKQNLDFAFLMMYAQSKGMFYVQLEDDVQSKPGYISTMKSFALQKSSSHKDWFVLDFCQLGFIGKMFKCAELPYLVQFFLMFYNDKPVDWLLDYLVQTKSCNLDKDSKHCKKAKDKLWIRYKPSLFQHVGTHSSLKGKVQKLKDKQFGKIQMYFPHINPPAKVETTIKAYKDFTLEKIYKGDSYFWGLLPQEGDHVTITFNEPQLVSEYLFRSGNAEHPSDRLYNTSVEVLPAQPPPSGTDVSYSPGKEKGYLVVGNFNDLGVAQGSLSASLGKLKVIRLCVHAESDNWAIISEIFIKPPKLR